MALSRAILANMPAMSRFQTHNPELVACCGAPTPAADHFLGHVQKSLAILFFRFGQQTLKHIEITGSSVSLALIERVRRASELSCPVARNDQESDGANCLINCRARITALCVLCNDPVTVAKRLTGDDHRRRIRASIRRLMQLAWGNLDAFTCLKNKLVMSDFQRQFTFQNKKELACMDV